MVSFPRPPQISTGVVSSHGTALRRLGFLDWILAPVGSACSYDQAAGHLAGRYKGVMEVATAEVSRGKASSFQEQAQEMADYSRQCPNTIGNDYNLE